MNYNTHMITEQRIQNVMIWSDNVMGVFQAQEVSKDGLKAGNTWYDWTGASFNSNDKSRIVTNIQFTNMNPVISN